MPKPYFSIKPPYPCPFCPHVTTTTFSDHKKHLAKHEQEQQKGRPRDLMELERAG